jgi:hypothetical protein
MALDEITATVKKDKTILMVGLDILRNKGAEKGGKTQVKRFPGSPAF